MNITEKLLHSIIGTEHYIKSIDTLKQALDTALQPRDNEDTYAAATICILYLSHYKLKFPASKLRTLYTNIKEETSLPLFDCKRYSSILSAIDEASLQEFELIDNGYNIKRLPVTRQEIFEALDFYTNQ